MTIDPAINSDIEFAPAARDTGADGFQTTVDQKTPKEEFGSTTPQWSADAPKGGKAVLTRALKESAAVPLFLAQTFVQSLRDVG